MLNHTRRPAVAACEGFGEMQRRLVQEARTEAEANENDGARAVSSLEQHLRGAEGTSMSMDMERCTRACAAG